MREREAEHADRDAAHRGARDLTRLGEGVGRRLLEELSQQASAARIAEMFVAADNEDTHALDFYRALGGGRVSRDPLRFLELLKGHLSKARMVTSRNFGFHASRIGAAEEWEHKEGLSGAIFKN